MALGNRAALEWILDQYKEKKPKDPTIREKFDTYRFADYKEKVIDLILRVSQLLVDLPMIREMDLNPILAFEHAVYAVDGRIRI